MTIEAKDLIKGPEVAKSSYELWREIFEIASAVEEDIYALYGIQKAEVEDGKHTLVLWEASHPAVETAIGDLDVYGRRYVRIIDLTGKQATPTGIERHSVLPGDLHAFVGLNGKIDAVTVYDNQSTLPGVEALGPAIDLTGPTDLELEIFVKHLRNYSELKGESNMHVEIHGSIADHRPVLE